MAGYSARQSTYTTGDTVAAADTNDEFNQLLAAFNATTGHTHDGTAGDGGPVTTLRDANGYNKVLIDSTNDHLEFYVNVSSSAVQQFRVEDGAIVPITDNDIDLGTSSLEFKDLHLDGTANIDSLVADTADINAGTVDAVIGGTAPAAGTFTTLTANTSLALASGATVTAINDEDTMSSDSATALATQQSIKAYVDTEIAALPIGDITAVNAGTGLSGGGTTGDVTLSIDTGTTVDLSTAQILTNKTLTAPVISTISNTGTLTLPTSTDTLVGKATTDILTNKTLTSPVLNGSLSGTAFLDEDTMSSDSATAVASQQSIKAYVDAQITAEDLDFAGDTGTGAVDLDSQSFTIAGTANEIETSASGQTITVGLPDAVTIKQLTLNPDTNIGKVLALEVQQGDVFKFGDVELYKDRTSGNHYITNPTASDNLSIGGDSVIINDSTQNKVISRFDFSGGNGVSYIGYYDSSTGYGAKLTTTNTGVDITGNAIISGDLTVSGNDITMGTNTDTAIMVADGSNFNPVVPSGDVTLTNAGVFGISSDVIVNADINASAAIDATKIHDGTISNTEFGYLNGVTSNIQTQLDSAATAGFSIAMAIAL